MWSILLCNTDRKLTGLNGIEMTGIIEIEGMEFFAYHGCFEAEQIVGNKFMVYACLHYNCHCPASTDDIADALSYQTAYEIIAREMMKRSHLLEHVGKRIMKKLFKQFATIEDIDLFLSKRNPPMGADIESAGIELHCSKK